MAKSFEDQMLKQALEQLTQEIINRAVMTACDSKDIKEKTDRYVNMLSDQLKEKLNKQFKKVL